MARSLDFWGCSMREFSLMGTMGIWIGFGCWISWWNDSLYSKNRKWWMVKNFICRAWRKHKWIELGPCYWAMFVAFRKLRSSFVIKWKIKLASFKKICHRRHGRKSQNMVGKRKHKIIWNRSWSWKSCASRVGKGRCMV